MCPWLHGPVGPAKSLDKPGYARPSGLDAEVTHRRHLGRPPLLDGAEESPEKSAAASDSVGGQDRAFRDVVEAVVVVWSSFIMVAPPRIAPSCLSTTPNDCHPVVARKSDQPGGLP